MPFIERPVVSITTATGGCRYVSVTWSVIDNANDDDMCGIGSFNITLTSMDISMTVITRMISYNFTELPDDAVFNVTVIGINVIGKSFISFAFASLKTMAIESMYIAMYIFVYCTYVYIYVACIVYTDSTYKHTHLNTYMYIQSYIQLHIYNDTISL